MKLLTRLLPRTLVGRVFGLYCLAMVLFVSTGLSLFYLFQFTVHLEEAQLHAETLTAVVAPAVADSAVIGDYDTIQRTLERAIRDARYDSAAFIDLKGGIVKVSNQDAPAVRAPEWLQALFEARLYDSNLPINVGGQDYGVLRLSFAPAHIAGDLWRQTRYALLLSAAGLVLGLLLIRWPLGRWLGNLDRIKLLEADIRAGHAGAQADLAADAPLELRQTFDVLNRAAATLQAQRAQAAVTLGAIADGVITLDSQRRIVMANPAACAMLHCPLDALMGRDATEALPEIFAAPQTLTPWSGRRNQLQRGDRALVVDSALSLVAGQDRGEVAGHVLALRDMSEQDALDRQLRNEVRSREAALHALRAVLEGLLPGAGAVAGGASGPEDNLEAISTLIAALVGQLQTRGEQLDAIFALSPDGFVSFDGGHRINYVSGAFERLTGLSAEQVMGCDEAGLMALLTDRAEAGAGPLDLGRLRDAEADGGPARLLLELVRPTRRVLELGLNQGSSGSISQVLHLRDITHETEVDRMKSEFLSTAAHELRTPMTSIHGFVELLLLRDPPAERRKDMLGTVHRQSALMISILNELLDLARIEARQGKDFALETLDLCELARDAIGRFSPPDGRASPSLQLPADAHGPWLVRGDRSKMLQALGNVLSNAYKYSAAPGTVTVRLLPHGGGSASALLGLQVEDQGIGMSPAQLARVTERFFRADASGNVPGTGLGMSIVKEIVDLQGGRLALNSREGLGTEVALWLPAAPSAPTTDADD